jgi:sugar/nucleoside kinase (ribokinase family)
MMKSDLERKGVIASGNWIVDHIKIIDVYPVQDSLANIEKEYLNNGGSPFNLLKDLALMGAKFPLKGIGLTGNDADGNWIKDECIRHNIDSSQILQTNNAHTSYTDVMTVKSNGRRTFFHQRGANALLDETHFDFSACREKIFHLGYILLLDKLDSADENGVIKAANVLEKALRSGLKTSIDIVSEDSGRFKSIVMPILPFVDYLFINEFEAERSTGVTLTGELPQKEALRKAARIFIDSGVRDTVFIHFPKGVFALNKAGQEVIQGAVIFPPKQIVSTVGAGDAFASGVIFGLHENWDIERTLKLGVCTAAASLEDVSCSGGVKNYKQCLKLGEEYSFHQLF